ncbi:hypothetical protein POTOM_050886 [Populus tomentosa]|uniref:Uncharacterized protein n=1 Tax=Populus tomentosa TaxID=118781 RepID=A0A8X8C2M8_POPTO|nr:hypothetical protein POTOM_050886 [Populus tomentosa]
MEETRTNMPFESVASETGDSTLIVNGTSSSQEEAEISATYSWSHSPERDHAAATRIQKHYRGFRTRRNLADSIIAAELLWQTTLFHIQKMGKLAITVNIESEKHIGTLLECMVIYPAINWPFSIVGKLSKFDSYKVGDLKRRESIFTTGKPTSVQLRMNTASSTQHSISELTKAWKTWKGALKRWLEVIDPRHRVGRNLSFYFQEWMTVGSGQPFFYWLDVGDGKTEEHPECSRDKLRHERNTYLELTLIMIPFVLDLYTVAGAFSFNINVGMPNQHAGAFTRANKRVGALTRQANRRQLNPLRPWYSGASNSEAVQSPASLIHWRQRSFSAINVEEDLNNNQRTQNGPADGFNLKDLLRRIFYTMNLLLEIATAVLDYLSSQQRQPRYALSGMILSITVMAITLIQLAYIGGKEGVSLQWNGWIPWQTTLSHTQKMGPVPSVNIESEKHIGSLLKWAETRVEKHWISELTKAWKTWKGALQRWLEVIDPRHRVGRNQKWMTVGSGQPFFYWLDVGDGKTEEHPECSRDKLRDERNTDLELVSISEAVESLMSLVLRSESKTEKDINNNQREHNRAYGFNQQDLWRRIFYAMNLLFEIATAVLDYLSSQQRQPQYDTVNHRHGHLLDSAWSQVVELFFSVSQCVSAIIAYHYLSPDQNNPAQFCIYPVVFAFGSSCLSFRRREP